MFLKNLRLIFLINFLFLSAAGICLGQDISLSGELQSVLASAGQNEPVPVIIHLAEQADLKSLQHSKNKRLRRAALIKALKHKKDQSQKGLIAFLRKNKIKEFKQFWIFNGISAVIPAHLVKELAARPEVSRVTLDSKITAPEITTASITATEWNIQMINAPRLWSLGFNGSGVVVASMDTGVDYLHPDLESKWRGGGNSWFDPYGEHETPYDKTGHGTGVMGIILGGDAGGTAIGVAPGARWIAAKIFNDNDLATLSGIHQSFQWLLDPDDNPETDDAPDIINNSWYFENTVNECNNEFAADIAALKTAGIAVVFSAGNTGPGTASSVSPANNPGALAVGATDQWQFVTGDSGRGPSACDAADVYPALVAPGAYIRTADLSFGGLPGSYFTFSGTSYAAPHVSGAMALLLSAMPDITVSELESVLKLAAHDLEDPGPDNNSGYGMVDPYKAFLTLRPPSIAPVLMLLLDG